MSSDRRRESLLKFKPSRRSPLSDNEADGIGPSRNNSNNHNNNHTDSSRRKRSLTSSNADDSIAQQPNTKLSNSSTTTTTTATTTIADATATTTTILRNAKRQRLQSPASTRNRSTITTTRTANSSAVVSIQNDTDNTNFKEVEEEDQIGDDEDDEEEEDAYIEDGKSIPPELLIRFKKFSLFQNAPNAFFIALGRCLRPVQYNPQEYIVKSGEPAKSMYWILRGTVGVTSTDGEATYAELAAGSFFGEIGILFDRPRTATVVSRTRVLLGVLTKDALEAVLADFPTIERLIRDEGQERLVMQEKRKRSARMSVNPSRMSQRIDPLINTPINHTASLVANEYDQVPGPALPPITNPGPVFIEIFDDTPIQQQQHDSNSSIKLHHPRPKSAIKNSRTSSHDSHKHSPLSSKAPIYNNSLSVSSPDSLRGQSSVSPHALHAHTFTQSPVPSIDNSISTRDFLKSLPVFKTLPSDVFHELALSVEIIDFKTMEYIFRKGDSGIDIYFVVYGEIEVLNPDLPGRVIARLGAGKYFGEMAFLSSLSDSSSTKLGNRSADIRAVSDCEVLIVKGNNLNDLCKRYPLVAEDMKSTAGERLKNNDSVGNLIHSTEITPRDRVTVDSLLATNEPDIYMENQRQPPLFKNISWESKTTDVEETNSYSDADEDNDSDVSKKSIFSNTSEASTTFKGSFSFAPRDGNKQFNNHIGMTIDSEPPDSESPSSQLVSPQRSTAQQQNFSPAIQPRKTSLSMPVMNPVYGSIYRFNNPPRQPFQYTAHDLRLRLADANNGRRRSSFLTNGPLPDSIFLKIFGYLNLPTLMKMSRVCRRWKQLIFLGNDLFKVLDLTPYNRDLDDEGLIQITNFVGSRPEVIDISNCFHITDRSFSYLINEVGIRGSIKKLYMKNNWNISAMAIMDLSVVGRELNEIDLSNCRKVRDDVVVRLIGCSTHDSSRFGCRNLSTLNFSYCKYLTDKTMMNLAMNANEQLTSLNLTRCTTITDNGFAFWSQTTFPRLKQLILRDCTFISDNAITALATSCPHLEELDLTFCCVLTDNALAILYLCCKALRVLNMSFCGSAVSDNSLVSISRLPILEKLIITGCIRVTRQGIDMLLSNSKTIKYLDLSQCPRANIYQGTPVEPFEKVSGTRSAFLKVRPYERIVKLIL